MTDSTFITRVMLKNYKSIADCDVRLGPLTFLVGPNGSGKSNFLDALRFVGDAVRTSPGQAIRERGGSDAVLRHGVRRSRSFSVRVEFRFGADATGHYVLTIGSHSRGEFKIQHEECTLRFVNDDGMRDESFCVRNGKITYPQVDLPDYPTDRLFLSFSYGYPSFRPVVDAFFGMGFYNINPSLIRSPQPPGLGWTLMREGSNLASVLDDLSRSSPNVKARIVEYLSQITPGLLSLEYRASGAYDTIEFIQQLSNSSSKRFSASNMSDGTLRALGVLVAIFLPRSGVTPPIRLVGIEEPEIALHPAAAGVLLDALRDASTDTQVLLTSHSPDLLDNDEIPSDAIRAVVATNGRTQIGPLNPKMRELLDSQRFTSGELLRIGQLQPDPDALRPTDLVATDHPSQ